MAFYLQKTVSLQPMVSAALKAGAPASRRSAGGLFSPAPQGHSPQACAPKVPQASRWLPGIIETAPALSQTGTRILPLLLGGPYIWKYHNFRQVSSHCAPPRGGTAADISRLGEYPSPAWRIPAGCFPFPACRFFVPGTRICSCQCAGEYLPGAGMAKPLHLLSRWVKGSAENFL